MKNQGKMEHHQELHKLKNKKNHHEHHKKKWKWNQKKDSFETNKCKEIKFNSMRNRARIKVLKKCKWKIKHHNNDVVGTKKNEPKN